MSNFARRTKNPVTGKFESAVWMDHGHRGYEVIFPTGHSYKDDAFEWEFEDEKTPYPKEEVK